MAQQLSLIYTGWPGYQERLVAVITPLTREQLALSLPHHWSIERITAHIVAARVWWLCSRVGEGSSILAPLEHWDETCAPIRSAEELLYGLDLTWQRIADVLAKWTPADLVQVLPEHQDDPKERTRQWIIWHLIEHDIHHGSEISSILGSHGLIKE